MNKTQQSEMVRTIKCCCARLKLLFYGYHGKTKKLVKNHLKMQVALYTDVLFAAYLMNKVRTSGGMKENIFLQTLLLKKTHLTGST